MLPIFFFTNAFDRFPKTVNLTYAGVLLSLSVPVVYDKFQDHIDEKLCVIHRILQTQYRKIDEKLLKKIPLPLNKEKKIQ